MLFQSCFLGFTDFETRDSIGRNINLIGYSYLATLHFRKCYLFWLGPCFCDEGAPTVFLICKGVLGRGKPSSLFAVRNTVCPQHCPHSEAQTLGESVSGFTTKVMNSVLWCLETLD